MRLVVHVIEARNLPAAEAQGQGDPYAKLQLGRQRAKTKVIRKSANPVWDEEFAFRVGDLKEELLIRVTDEDKYFSDDFLGQLRVPLSAVLDADNRSLGTHWYPLQPKSKKSKIRDCGEIHLTISLSQSYPEETATLAHWASDDFASSSDKSSELRKGSSLPNIPIEISASPPRSDEAEITKEDKSNVGPSFVNRLQQIFSVKPKDTEVSVPPLFKHDRGLDTLEEMPSTSAQISDEQDSETSVNMSFDELLKAFASKHEGNDMPGNLSGGVLIDQVYAVAPSDLNALIFSPSSEILQSLAKMQGTTGLDIQQWRLENDGEILKRVITYTKAATKLVKAVKATEDVTYLKADGDMYAVLADVSTPEVPFGNNFRVEVLTCIMPGPEVRDDERSSQLVISWRVNFMQSTMMKGMIENGAKQGLKDNFNQVSELLAQNVRPVDAKDTTTNNESLSSVQPETESDWKLAFRIFGNFTVVSSVVALIYVFAHIILASPSVIQGLEFPGLDLPDSVGEVVVCGVLVLQGQRVLNMIARFVQARRQRGGDHGVKAKGDGWLLTVALIDGTNLAATKSSGYSDPYVVFTCNGQTKTSSIKFHTLEPQWNEIFEFDAMEDPPSVMEINVYDFDGPFDEVASLGHVEINFLKYSISELADIWIPLKGKLAQACQSKLHLRIFLNNSRGTEVVKDYLDRMEKEVGRKIAMRSPHTNLEFQKIFALPPEEFLINDFTCHLKRKMLTQGRLFLSPRIIGFYTNLFGHKTKFFFLWEDIEEIQLVPATLSSMGSPSLLITLRKGRGLDARHGAKQLDDEGRLKFHLQSFVSFNAAHKTIIALWKARSLTPEEKIQLVEEESETKDLQNEEGGSFLGTEDVKMSEVFSSAIPFDVPILMGIFEGGPVERRIMEKVGCMDYSVTAWEPVRADVHQRQVHYRLDKKVARREGEVMSTQQKCPLPDKNGWLVEEVMTLEAPYSIPVGAEFVQAEVMQCPSIYWHGMAKELQESKEDHARGGIEVVFSPQEDIWPT
ncbi:C2 and GRAM domain-containing protein At1g03370 isoform X2 [Hordeum vulgare subsp. vulgare]|uniref:C2 and GRAM domain-containing protein At1g03370 isoform X2 n=1 Tax=Hordeum vulgare subsp. vulgare TaxID=112509 RepID=UPI0002955DF4|nr:C2 and GRAM domain-containing protein At1g03370 isoform X2 [Hordeum vulgare subsp. vulgare]